MSFGLFARLSVFYFARPAALPSYNTRFIAMPVAWDAELVRLLNELSEAQDELFVLVREKQQYLQRFDGKGLAEMAPREEALIKRLEHCQAERAALLAQAGEEGLPADSLRSLTKALPRPQRLVIVPQIDAAASRARLLRHHSLTNWMTVQRTLLHLSRMIEIIATGGRLQPTYGEESSAQSGGNMLDEAA